MRYKRNIELNLMKMMTMKTDFHMNSLHCNCLPYISSLILQLHQSLYVFIYVVSKLVLTTLILLKNSSDRESNNTKIYLRSHKLGAS